MTDDGITEPKSLEWWREEAEIRGQRLLEAQASALEWAHDNEKLRAALWKAYREATRGQGTAKLRFARIAQAAGRAL